MYAVLGLCFEDFFLVHLWLNILWIFKKICFKDLKKVNLIWRNIAVEIAAFLIETINKIIRIFILI